MRNPNPNPTPCGVCSEIALRSKPLRSRHGGSSATTGGAALGTMLGTLLLRRRRHRSPRATSPLQKGMLRKGLGKELERSLRELLRDAFPGFRSCSFIGCWTLVVPIMWLASRLLRRVTPKTVCQTATGDLVEVESDTHATIEVNFLTTRPLEKQGNVLSTFACTCRLEAIVSDQIRHNLTNLNLLCWKCWKPTLYEGS